jgi:hypothetical protein
LKFGLRGQGVKVRGSDFLVWGSGFMVHKLGFGLLGFIVKWFILYNLRYEMQRLGSRVQGSGFRV